MNETTTLYVVFAPLVAYLIGAIPFGLIIARLFGIKDIRRLGSGNIGATNVWRVVGPKAAILVFIADIGKGIIAVLIGKLIYDKFMITQFELELFIALCGLMAIVGHVFPVYLKFNGGKGVNTGLGVVVTLLPIQTLISLCVFLLTVLLSRFVSLGSIMSAITLCAILLIQKFVLGKPVSLTYVILTSVICTIVLITHRTNITRIINGTENKFSLSSNSSRNT